MFCLVIFSGFARYLLVFGCIVFVFFFWGGLLLLYCNFFKGSLGDPYTIGL